MKILTTILFSLTLGVSLTQAADAPQSAGQGREKMKAMVLQKFDVNKNGTLDPEEKAAAMQERRGKSGGIFGGGPPTSEGGSKFRRPPEAPKEGDAAK